MLSFRQKIFITYFILFFLFIIALYPLAFHTVQTMISRSLEERADELIVQIKEAPNDDALITMMKNRKHQIFFRVAIINEQSKVLYDSHAKRRLGEKFSQDFVIDHPEIRSAQEKGVGVFEGESYISDQRMFYMAKAFDFHGKRYILRVAIPQKYVADATLEMRVGLVVFSVIILLLFSLMTWVIINHLTSPIQQIITAVRAYQEGKVELLPKISIATTNPKDDFKRLADTLNILSHKIQGHINTLTQERNEKAAILESLVEGVIAVNAAMEVTYVNNRALRFLGKKESNEIPVRYRALLEECQKEQNVLTEEIELEIEGRTLYIELTAAPKKGQSGAILVMQDKSAHHRILEMRKDFIANASHELKTPITIIRGFAETIHENPDLPQETMADITGKIVHSCERMTRLIKNLLTLSDIEHLNAWELTPCSLSDIVEACRAMIKELYPDAHISVASEGTPPFMIKGDPQLLELAVMNLLENAAKYSDAPAQIDIRIKEEKGQYFLSIADKGIGIPKEEIEQIFQRFYRVDRRHSRKKGGAGLGLSLVETIIQKHHAHITVESEPGKGSVFTIIFPKE